MPRIHEIVTSDDPAIKGWLRLLNELFPPQERVQDEEITGLVANIEAQITTNERVLALFTDDRPEEVAGMVWHADESSVAPDHLPFRILWYLGISPQLQGDGLGSFMYQSIYSTLASYDLAFMVMEVETLTEAKKHGDGRRLADAVNRLRFYVDRHKAYILTGVHYEQRISGQDPLPMHLVCHLPDSSDVSPEAVYATLKSYFKDALQLTGDPIDLTRHASCW